MKIIHVTVKIKPENRAAFLQSSAQFIHQARVLPGCREFKLYQDSSDENCFAYYEEWESAEAFSDYEDGDLMATYRSSLAQAIAAPPVSNRYTATAVAQRLA